MRITSILTDFVKASSKWSDSRIVEVYPQAISKSLHLPSPRERSLIPHLYPQGYRGHLPLLSQLLLPFILPHLNTRRVSHNPLFHPRGKEGDTAALVQADITAAVDRRMTFCLPHPYPHETPSLRRIREYSQPTKHRLHGHLSFNLLVRRLKTGTIRLKGKIRVSVRQFRSRAPQRDHFLILVTLTQQDGRNKRMAKSCVWKTWQDNYLQVLSWSSFTKRPVKGRWSLAEQFFQT